MRDLAVRYPFLWFVGDALKGCGEKKEPFLP